MNIIPVEQVKSINWEEHKDDYDQQLYKLGGDSFDSFYIINPDVDQRYIRLIDTTISSLNCVIWMLGDVWAIKRFQKGWTDGYVFNQLEWSDFIPNIDGLQIQILIPFYSLRTILVKNILFPNGI